MVDYNAVQTAVKVADCGSFTGAGKLMAMPSTTVSARVQALEQTLGVKLFERSTRRVRLTEAGRIFYEHAKRGSEAFDDAVTAATRIAQRPRGLLRVVAPSLFARHLLPGLLPRFLARYPDLTLTFDAVNVLPDLVQHGADIAIAVGRVQRATYTRRALFTFSQCVYASPTLASARDTPAKPEDLASWPLLTIQSGPEVRWVLTDGSQTQELQFQPKVSMNDVSAIHELTLAGIGAALLPQQLCIEHSAGGNLVRLLPEWNTPPVEVSAYFSGRRLAPGKVQVFLDYLEEWFARPQPRPTAGAT